ncbi:hypothetical protein WT83_16485 [Burkholderia territorii]|uniref:Type III secretion protein HpaP n=1 Tax=Burkholderia territorii TaxID=1503055 RepID=A0A108ENW3_9BURK|nr:hypothetical protein WT83_16485 [Burkholderia territorii]
MAADDAGARLARDARRFDYAGLLTARRTVLRPVSDVQADSRQSSDPCVSPEHSATSPEEFLPTSNGRGTPSPNTQLPPVELTECRTIATHIESAAVPIASIMMQQQYDHSNLLGTLSREIAAFCGDTAIATGGPWEAYVVLNERILPSTELHVSLSHFDLQLRFDARDREAHRLLSGHCTALERELDAMLRAWGCPRSVRITVW